MLWSRNINKCFESEEIDSIENWKLSDQFSDCLQPPLINTKKEVVEKSSNFMTFIIYQRQVRALRLFFQLFTLVSSSSKAIMGEVLTEHF